MQRFLEFLQAHPILFTILAVLVVLFLVLESRRSGGKVSPQSLGIMVNRDKAVLIDLRDSKDFREGHISGSRNIPFSQLKNHVAELQALGKPIVMICNMGQVAGSAVQTIGGTQMYRLDGGIMNWKSNGLPLIKGK